MTESTTPAFTAGDKVIFNKTTVATVLTYDTELGRIVLQVDLPGGGTDTVYGPISSYDLELLVRPAETEAPAAPVEAPVEAPAAPADEITTSL